MKLKAKDQSQQTDQKKEKKEDAPVKITRVQLDLKPEELTKGKLTQSAVGDLIESEEKRFSEMLQTLNEVESKYDLKENELREANHSILVLSRALARKKSKLKAKQEKMQSVLSEFKAKEQALQDKLLNFKQELKEKDQKLSESREHVHKNAAAIKSWVSKYVDENKKASDFEEQNKKLNTELVQLKKSRDDVFNQHQLEINSLLVQIDILRGEIKEQMDALDAERVEHKKAKDMVTKLSNEIHAVKEQKKKMESSLDKKIMELTNSWNSSKTQASDLQAKNSELMISIDILKGNVSSLEQKIQQLKTKKKFFKHTLKQVEQKNEEFRNQLSKQESDISFSKDQWNVERETLLNEIGSLKNTIESMRSGLEEEQKQISDYSESFKKLQDKFTGTNERIKTLQEAIRGLERDNSLLARARDTLENDLKLERVSKEQLEKELSSFKSTSTTPNQQLEGQTKNEAAPGATATEIQSSG